MKAIGFTQNLPAEDAGSLIDFETPTPTPGARDLLVRIEAISVNPVDTKVRKSRKPESPETPVILGWDAAGVVEAAGPETSLFRPGDEVFFAGDLTRPGTNAEFTLVDERIVGRKPRSLSFADAAALPLTSITAWESLFDRFRIPVGKSRTGDAILILGAAGGVGSIAVQLARRLTGLTVIGTASRPESQAWVRERGAHHVIDHSASVPEQLAAIGHPAVRYVLSLTHTDRHWDAIVESVAPQGAICFIDDPAGLDVMRLKRKAVALHTELMFTRPMFQTPDMIQQHHLLNEVADLVDEGLLRTTAGQMMGRIDAATLRRAHAAIESGRSIGKIVLAGF
ncbi:zinc-binding alcohol dehydrogenase family protein [Arenibaculum pallidiluteum]|uniref:zinc-binding alcohol dehydrogenase family protein n=1 Tax=Arenibaculum pallidiluteum TaxID=2812559 RepID=UPI001A96C40D|nr:zinc-binding alcohol dehydrogenase family protein [Arenibaculum pallidiluteum]